jgi:HK97 family phage major capsid protein
MSQEDYRARIAELEEERKTLDADSAGRRFSQEEKDRWNDLSAELEEASSTLKELEQRAAQIAAAAGDEKRTEDGAHFQVRRPNAPTDIWDLSTLTRSWDDPAVEKRELHDRAMRAIDGASYPHPDLDDDVARAHVEKIMGDPEMASYEGGDLHSQRIARHVLATGSPGYKRAFTKYLAGAPRTAEDEGYLHRSMSLSGASGGVAVPFVLDPTLLPSYNGAVNPYRNIADVRTITVDEWRGVTSAGITAAFQAEAAATTDASPTLASVSISTEMARVAIPYSIEIGMDWGSFASDMASEIQNSKDVLEAAKFATGSGTNEPFGVVTGATTLFTSSDSAALYAADFYGWHDALPPLYRSRAVFAMNNATLSRLRQLDTAGGSNMLTPNLQLRSAANVGGPGAPDMTDSRANVDLFGKAVHESSGIAAFADNALIGVFGAFNPYFKIIDRVGLSIENIPHFFDATTGFPTGQRALFAYWRVGSKVVAANAFRTLRVA